jgi:hypothetical protein
MTTMNSSVFGIPPLGPGVKKKERAFDLNLPARVQGRDLREGDFSELTEITSVSAEEAVLRLRSQVPSGAKILLTLQVPSTRFLEKPLELSLSGTIRTISSALTESRVDRVISVKLDPRFRIQFQSA